jgi:Uma2 family endonuclease
MCDMAGRWTATVEDLYRVAAKKAELVGGRLVVMSPGGGLHGFAAVEIVVSLHDHARRTQRGHAVGDSVGFVVNLPHRRSFCPDAAFCTQPLTEKFVEGAPVFAVEVRSTKDYGPAAESRMARKRADYFAAGTKVVWDVDVLRNQLVRAYRASDALTPAVFTRGELAEAEPAVPGWSMPVDDLFPVSTYLSPSTRKKSDNVPLPT